MRMTRFNGISVGLAALLLVMAGILPGARAQTGQPFHLTIVHSSEHHAHVEQFQLPNQPVQGGMPRRATLVERWRAENPNMVLLDAGDVMQGTLYFNQYAGQADLYFMNAMRYDAMVLGNHEFDKGQEALAALADNAQFPLLSANIDFSGSPLLQGKVAPYTVLNVGGQKVGVIGLTNEETGIASSPGPGIAIARVVEAASRAVAELQGQGVDKIIALTHIGYEKDKYLASAVDGLDVVVGGHTETLLGDKADLPPFERDPDGPYPTVVKGRSGDPVLVVHANIWGRYLGKLDVDFDADGRAVGWGGGLTFLGEDIPEDPALAAKVQEFAAPIAALKETVVGSAAVDLNGERDRVRKGETNLGDLVADAMLEKTGPTGAQVAIMNGGGIRTSIPAGQVTLGQVLEVLPFGNALIVFDLPGSALRKALENGLSRVAEGAGRFPQVSGLHFSYDPNAPPGARLTSIEVRNEDGYQPLDEDALYRVVTNDFMQKGGDDYTAFAAGRNVLVLDFLIADTVAEYIGAHSPVSPQVDGRILPAP
jgi:5'-nucleotidase / UDP-sugar diphosphatase